MSESEFDTIAFIERMKKVDFTTRQAEALAREYKMIFDAWMARKANPPDISWKPETGQ